VIAGLFFPAGLANEASQRALATVADVLIPAFFVSSACLCRWKLFADLFRWSGLLCLVTSPSPPSAQRSRSDSWPAGCSAGRLPPQLNLHRADCRGIAELAIASVGLQAH